LPNVKIIGVDPVGSILALPESLNGPIASYKVEGIGYDFIPAVLDRDLKLVDKWYKTEDKESLVMARKLIKQEGLLCGGSSGTAMVAAIRACKDFNLPSTARCVVILPDSVRNYMSKFLNDDWMVKNGMMSQEEKNKGEVDAYGGAVIRDLNIPDAICVAGSTTCEHALSVLQQGGFDQVPVIDEHKKMMGLVTTGNLLSKVAKGRVKPSDPVTKAMFKFNTKKPFTEITPDTKLADLQKFFEKNSAAFVTVRENGEPVVKKVFSKVDLLSHLMRKSNLK